MERLKQVIADTVFVVQILIAFIVVFESRIEVPPLLQSVGRLHPVMLHLPIGLLLVTTLFIFTRQFFRDSSLGDLISFLLHVTALTASFTTIMGLLLSLEGTFGADQLWLHKWLGVALSFLCWSLLMVKSNVAILKTISLAGVIVLVFTGHFGANLTHGEDFVFAPLRSEEVRVARIITDSAAVFSATIEPIFESKCYGCHNSRKAKGDLVLTSIEQLMKGGKNGELWKPGDAGESHLVQRLNLPLEDEEHMPPKDKAQLTEDEIYFISLWIDAGADTEIKLNELTEGDTLKQLASVIIPRYQQHDGDEPLYTFDFASRETIEKLRRPNRNVFQIASHEPAVHAEFYLRDKFEKEHLQELVSIKEQLVLLNLTNMPVEDADLATIAKFDHLEVLNLNKTKVKGASGFKELASLSKLRSLSLSGTEVSLAPLLGLGNSKSLEEVFIWNTAITEKDLVELNEKCPRIRWAIGYRPDENEILKLSAPLLGNRSQVIAPEEKVIIRHTLPGTVVRYTLDETEVDSLGSPVFSGPLTIGNYARMRTRAYKEGWISSDVKEFVFFREGLRPDSVVLLTKPDERYKGEGGITLIDENKGHADNLRHPAWLGFRETDLIASFIFETTKPPIMNITLSYARDNGMGCMPPDEVQVWAGNAPEDLRLIKKMNPREAGDPKGPGIEGVSIDLPATGNKYGYYKLVAKRAKKLKAANGRKRDPWLMVDEVFFN